MQLFGIAIDVRSAGDRQIRDLGMSNLPLSFVWMICIIRKKASSTHVCTECNWVGLIRSRDIKLDLLDWEGVDRACNACFVTRGNRSILALEEINAKGKSTELVKSSQNILNSLQAMAKLFQSNILGNSPWSGPQTQRRKKIKQRDDEKTGHLN